MMETRDWLRWRRRRAHHAAGLRRLVRSLPSPVLLSDVPGNTGDLLIASGVDALLGGVLRDRVRYGEHGGHGAGRTLVVPGSGAWSPAYHEWMPDLVLAASASYERVLVLPSSYDPSVPEVQRALSRDNVIALSREQTSVRLLAPLGHPGFSLDCAVFSPLVARPTSAGEGGAPLICLRTDAESALGGAQLPPGNIDLSSEQPTLRGWLDAVLGAGHLITDRAHVMIAGTLLGRRVDFTDGTYWKNSALADATFGGLFRRRLTQLAPEQLLARVEAVR